MLLMTRIKVIPNKEIMMTKKEVLKGNTPVTEDSQYCSQGEMIGMKLCYMGAQNFHDLLNPILITAGADYTS